jgi:hypothetical protein
VKITSRLPSKVLQHATEIYLDYILTSTCQIDISAKQIYEKG